MGHNLLASQEVSGFFFLKINRIKKESVSPCRYEEESCFSAMLCFSPVGKASKISQQVKSQATISKAVLEGVARV